MLGVDGNPKFRALKNEITYKREEFRSEYSVGQFNTHTFALGDHDKIIVGFQIISWWNDGTNGWFQMRDGNVLDSEIKLDVSSYRTRGCRWEVQVWMVSKLLYEKRNKDS